MRRRRWIVLAWAAWACGCEPAPAPDEQAPHEQPEAPHEHEERHDEVPRSVSLSDEVIAAAGIVTEPVQRRVLSPSVRLPGEVVADPDREARAAARVDGIVQSVAVRVGDRVEQGQLLARVRAPDLQSLRAAEAVLRAKAEAARANAERVQSLLDSRMASEQEALVAKTEADALATEADAARARLRALGVGRAKGDGFTYEVRAPRAGVVIDRPVAVGQPVTPADVVATVVATDEVWFIAHLFERDVARVEEGATATVRLNAHPDEGLPGRVEYLSHRVDEGARTLSLRIPLPNPEGRLRLGLFGTAHVVVAGTATEPVLAVPTSAITRMQGVDVVFVRQDDGDFEVHEVVLGVADPSFTEVVHGLHEGEQVVSEGAFSVKSVLLRDTLGEDHH